MKSILPYFALLVVFASCTTAYKSGQTPDDVYFSPTRPHDEYVRTENKPDQYSNDEQYQDDRYLRMKVHNRRTWSDLDYYYSDPFAYNYRPSFNTYGNIYYNTPWDYYSSWNYYYNPYSNYYNYNNYNPYYNPYGSKVVIVNPRPPVYNSPRRFNLNVYNPPAADHNSYNSHSQKGYRGDSRDFNYNTNNNSYNSRNNSGSSLRNIFGGNNNSSSNMSTSRPSTSTSNSSSGSSRSSSSSSNAPVRKF